MDRITKAIELAREKNIQRAQGFSSVPTPAKVNHTVANARRIEVDSNELAKNRIMSEYADAPAADAYRLLRTRVLQRMRQNKWVTLGVTSTRPRAGKSLTSINLSIAISMDPNHSVLLVDTDMRRPSVAGYFGFEVEHGLGAYLTEETPTKDLIVSPGIDDFAILPCEAGLSGTSELITSAQMSRFVEQVRKSSSVGQVTVFDLPPIMVGDDVLAFSSHLDAILIVVEDGVTERPDVDHALHLLKDANVLGCVLNKSNETSDQSYGGYY